MAKLEIEHTVRGREVVVTLSRRNILSLLHKLDMPGSARQIENNDCWENGEQLPILGHLLVLRCETDDEHYAARDHPPGRMHPDTEKFVQENSASDSSESSDDEEDTCVV